MGVNRDNKINNSLTMTKHPTKKTCAKKQKNYGFKEVTHKKCVKLNIGKQKIERTSGQKGEKIKEDFSRSITPLYQIYRWVRIQLPSAPPVYITVVVWLLLNFINDAFQVLRNVSVSLKTNVNNVILSFALLADGIR